jgi:hypothetical protein
MKLSPKRERESTPGPGAYNERDSFDSHHSKSFLFGSQKRSTIVEDACEAA